MKLASLCYIVKDKKVLMLHRNNESKSDHYQYGKHNGVGGKFEAGEDPYDCAIREIYEETNLKAKSIRLRGLLTFPNFDGKDDWYCFVFLVDQYEGDLLASDEGSLLWHPIDQLNELNLYEGDKYFLPWVFEDHRFFSAKFYYENEKYIRHEVRFS